MTTTQTAQGDLGSDPFRERLGDEVAAWLRDGLIGATSARRVLRRYGLDLGAEHSGSRRFSGIVVGLGAVLMGLGTILFVGSNWPAIDRPWRLALLLAALVAAYGAAALARRRGQVRTSAALVFVGTMAFGANVFLTGQTYHLAVDDPLIPFLWMAGAIPVAIAAVSRPSLLVALLAGLLAYGMFLGQWGAWKGPDPLVPIAFLCFGSAAVFLAETLETARSARPFGVPLRVVGAVLVSLVLSGLGFADVWKQLGRAASSSGPGATGPVELSVGLAAVLFAASAAAFAWRSGWRRQHVSFALASAGLVLAVAVLILWHPFDDPSRYAWIVNALIMATVLTWSLFGLFVGRDSFINVALMLFGVTAFGRYVDLASTLFDRSLVFVGAGALLLVGGYLLERGRQRLLRVRAEVTGDVA